MTNWKIHRYFLNNVEEKESEIQVLELNIVDTFGIVNSLIFKKVL